MHKVEYKINNNSAKTNIGILFNLIINKVNYIICFYKINENYLLKNIQIINNKYSKNDSIYYINYIFRDQNLLKFKSIKMKRLKK